MTKGHPDPQDIQLGRLIRKRRLELGLSQQALASKLGITYQQVQHYERGIGHITAGRLQQISRALKADAGYFFEEKPRSTPKQFGSVLEIAPDAQFTKLMTAFQKITSAKKRRNLVALAEILAGGGQQPLGKGGQDER